MRKCHSGPSSECVWECLSATVFGVIEETELFSKLFSVLKITNKPLTMTDEQWKIWKGKSLQGLPQSKLFSPHEPAAALLNSDIIIMCFNNGFCTLLSSVWPLMEKRTIYLRGNCWCPLENQPIHKHQHMIVGEGDKTLGFQTKYWQTYM